MRWTSAPSTPAASSGSPRGPQHTLATPEYCDAVPAGAAKDRLRLLNDLAVAAPRAIEPLEVAVDDEHEVVEALVGRHVERAEGLRLVRLAVAEARPDAVLARVLEAPRVEVAV